MNNYYKGEELRLESYLKLPKELILQNEYKKLDANAKILYSLMLDRCQLSLKNDWVDKEDRVYIYFSLDSAMDLLSLSNKTINKLYNQLKQFDLIEIKRQGLGKPNIIYVKKVKIKNELKFNEEPNLETIENTKTCNIYTSEYVDSTLLNMYNLHTSYIKINNNKEEEEGNHLKFVNSIPIFKELNTKQKLYLDTLYNYKIKKFDIDLVKDVLKDITTDHFFKAENKVSEYEGEIKDMTLFYIETLWNTLINPEIKNKPRVKKDKKINSQNPSNMTNYEQREYDDDYFDSLYANI